MDEYDFYDHSTDYEDYHYQEEDNDYMRNSHRTSDSKNNIGCLQIFFGVAVLICGLAFISFIYKSCSGAIAQLYPDDDEFAVTDDYDYFHRKRCGCVDEDNFSEWSDLETAQQEGLKPCPYCKPITEEDE